MDYLQVVFARYNTDENAPDRAVISRVKNLTLGVSGPWIRCITLQKIWFEIPLDETKFSLLSVMSMYFEYFFYLALRIILE